MRTLLLALALSALALAAATRLTIDNSARAWLPSSDPALDTYADFRTRFGADDTLLAVHGPTPFDPDLLPQLHDWVDTLRHTPGVHHVQPPWTTDLEPTLHTRVDAALTAARRTALQHPSPPTHRLLAHLSLTAWALQDPDSPAALDLTQAAEQAAAQALHPHTPPAPLTDADPDALALWATARLARLRAAGFPTELLLERQHTHTAIEHLIAHADGLPRAQALLLRAAERAAPPDRGGDPAAALADLEQARPHAPALAALVHAEHLAPALAWTPPGAPLADVLTAQQNAYRNFVDPLQTLLRSPPPTDPALTLTDAIARLQAHRWLADPDAHGVITPDDTPPPARPPLTPYLNSGALGARGLYGPDPDWSATLVTPDPDLDPFARRDLLARLRAIPCPDTSTRWVGTDVVADALDRGSERWFGSLAPVVALVLGAVLTFALRAWRRLLAIGATAACVSLWILGLMGAVGVALNLVLVLVPAVLGVLVVAHALHLYAAHAERPDHEHGPARWRGAIADTWQPLALATLTTAAGYASLIPAGVPPVSNLGLYTALGTLLVFAATLTLLPAFDTLWPSTPHLHGDPHTAARRWITWLSHRGAPPVVALGTLALALGAVGLSKLHVESHVLHFLPTDSPVTSDYRTVEDHLTGLTPVELWLAGPTSDVASPQTLAALDAWTASLSDQPLVHTVHDPLAHPRDLPPSPRATFLRTLWPLLTDTPGVVTDDDTLHVRVHLGLRTDSSNAVHAQVETLRAQLQDAFPPTVQPTLTGAATLLVRGQVVLLDAQLRSFALALAAVTLTLLLAFRSLRLTLISLVPNLVPLAAVLGAMGWAGIPLDTATVTVAGIALGLIVDDTIHLLHAYHRARTTLPPPAAIERALAQRARPILWTTAAIALGFACFSVSPFRPTRDFGLLTAAAATAALLCDLLLLPALLCLPRSLARTSVRDSL